MGSEDTDTLKKGCLFVIKVVAVGDVQLLNRIHLFVTLWTLAHQASLSLTISPSLPSHVNWMSDAIQPSHPLLSPSPPLNIFQHQGLFQWVGSSHQSGAQSIGAPVSASVLPVCIQGSFPLGLTDLVSLLSRDSQESSVAPQFESIISLALSLLYGPTLTSLCNYCKNHSFDCTDLCRQSDVFAF